MADGKGETPRTCELMEMVMNCLRRPLLEGMLAYEPSKRVSVREVMESEFMVEWAWPALLRVGR